MDTYLLAYFHLEMCRAFHHILRISQIRRENKGVILKKKSLKKEKKRKSEHKRTGRGKKANSRGKISLSIIH